MLNFIRSHLQVRLTIAFVAVVLIPTVIITVFSISRSTDAIIQTTSEHEVNTSLLSAGHMQDYLANIKGDLIFLGNDPGPKDLANVLAGEDDPAALPDVYDLFSNTLSNTNTNYKDIRILDRNGQEVARVDEVDGQAVVVDGSALESHADRTYFTEALKLPPGGVYFSGLDLNDTNGVIDTPHLPIMRYSMPLYASNGQAMGVLVLKILAEPILADLTPDEGDENTYLIDSNGTYWVNPDASELYGSILETGKSFDQNQPNDAAVIRTNEEGVFSGSGDRPDSFQSFVHIRLEDQPGAYWTLINVRPLDEILSEVNQARTGILALSALAFILAIGAASVIAQSIVRPVRQLTTSASEISKDNWDSPLPENSRTDEIGGLTDSFQTMVSAVQSRNMALNDLNQSLTKQAKELSKANALARESVRLKSEFMSTMSHELRTPLNAILGFSGIILQGMGGEVDDEARHMIERIDLNSQRLLGLINDVLDLAKIEAGRMELATQPFSPRTLAERWRSQMSVLAEQKNLQFSILIDDDVPETITGDPERITQIAVNLISNAVKFTRFGRVTLNMQRQDTNLIIKVTDTGVGIPPHALNYIFDEFRQVDGTSTRVYGGSGLGLSIVRNLCRTMDGTVRVSSELGKGSIFTVSLPLNLQNTELETAETSLEMA